MIKKLLAAAVIVSVCFLFCAQAFAEEEVGFIKKSWRNFLNRGKQAEAPAKPAPIKQAPAKKAAAYDEEIVVTGDDFDGQMEVTVTETDLDTPRDEMVADLTDNLEIFGDDIMAKIPGIKYKAGTDGKGYFVYTVASGEEVRIGDLDDETLRSLYRRVGHESVILETENIQRQLELIRGPARIPRPPETPRTISGPPQIPTVPSGPPRPPTTPKGPPTPPPAPPRAPER